MPDGRTSDVNAYAPPALRGPIVERPDLVARIDAAADGALTLVVAPAGWGKTVAVTQWALAHGGGDVAVVEFRRGDNASVVAGLLLGAIAFLGAPVRRVAASSPDEFSPELRPFLAEQLHTLPACYVVLDSVDRLDERLQRDIGTLIEDAPPNAHFIATTRTHRTFAESAAAILARDSVAMVLPSDLAFDAATTTALLADHASVSVDAADADSLVARTGGWPVAIRNAATTARASENAGAAIRQFGSDDPRLRAFCRTEISAPLSPAFRKFLTQTSVVDHVDGALCAALTQSEAGGDMLTETRERELVEPVDESGRWWRYRTLLRDVLRVELHAANPTASARLLTLAAEWHTEQGTLEDAAIAASYLARAENWPALVAHINAHARLMHQAGLADAVVDWVSTIPIGTRRRSVAVSIMEAAVLTIAGETSRAEQALQVLDDVEELTRSQRLARATMRSVWVAGHAHPAQALAAVDEARELLEQVPDEHFNTLAGLVTTASTSTLLVIGKSRALWYLGDAQNARRVLEEDVRTGSSLPFARLHRGNALAEIEAWSGSLEAAAQHCRHNREVARELLQGDHPYLLGTDLAEAHVLIQRGALAEAGCVLDRAERSTALVHFDGWQLSYVIERARLALAVGSPQLALESLELLDAVTAKTMCVAPLLHAQLRAVTAQLMLAEGDRVDASRRLEDTDAAFPVVAGASVQIAIADRDFARAQTILERWPQTLEVQDALAHEWWSAVADFVENHSPRAVVAGIELLGRAEGEGVAALFLDTGPDAHRFLATIDRREPASYAAALLSQARDRAADWAANDSIVALSAKEREVLTLLAKRLTYAEIATHLFVSQNTVKTHAKHVYMKLGATGRRDAVGRAEELGLF